MASSGRGLTVESAARCCHVTPDAGRPLEGGARLLVVRACCIHGSLLSFSQGFHALCSHSFCCHSFSCSFIFHYVRCLVCAGLTGLGDAALSEAWTDASRGLSEADLRGPGKLPGRGDV